MAEMQGRGPEARQISRVAWIASLNIVAVGLLLFFLYLIRQVLLLAFVGALLALTFNPLVGWLERRRVPRLMSVLALSALIVGVLVLLGVFIVPLLVEQAERLVQSAPQLLERAEGNRVVQWLREHLQPEQLGGAEPGRSPWAAAAGAVVGVVRTVFGKVFAVVTALVMAVFMLIFGKAVLHRAIRYFLPAQRETILRIGAGLQKSVAGYVLGTLIIAAIGGTIITLALLIVGVPYFLPLGVAMFFLGVIPYLGPLLAAALILGVTFAVAGFKTTLIMAIVFVGYQVLENNVLQPVIQQRTIKLDPLLILVAITIGAQLGGVLGAILALPTAGAIQVIVLELLPGRSAPEGGDPSARTILPENPKRPE